MYAPQIAWWLSFYPPDRFLFLNQDKLKTVSGGTRGLGNGVVGVDGKTCLALVFEGEVVTGKVVNVFFAVVVFSMEMWRCFGKF